MTKEKINNFFKRIRKITRQQQTYEYTLYLSFILLLLIHYSIQTILMTILIILSLIQLIRIKKQQIQERGIISFLPRTIQVHLLDRSVFDLLCDIWYIPKISLYIKAFFKPFVSNISPEDAATALRELPDSAQKAIMTKGLINFLPNFMQSAIMPEFNHDCLDDELTNGGYYNDNIHYVKQRNIKNNNNNDDNEDQDSLGSTNTTKSTKFQQNDDFYDHNNNNIDENNRNKMNNNGNQNEYYYRNNTASSTVQQQNTLKNNFMKEINIKEELQNNNNLKKQNNQRCFNKNAQHEFSFNNNLFMLSQNEPNTFINQNGTNNNNHSSNSNNINLNNKWSNQSLEQSTSSEDDNLLNSSHKNFYDIFHNRGTLSDEDHKIPKTKLIASSFTQLMSSSDDSQLSPPGTTTSLKKQNSSKPKIAEKWDKLEFFRNRIKENYKKFIQIKPTNANAPNNKDQLKVQNKPNFVHSLRSILHLFHNIMELKKMGNLSSIDNKKLLKIFIISSCFMGAQVMGSRRARRWMVNTSLMLLYVLSFLLTTGTLGIIAMKYHQESQNKAILNKDITNQKSQSKNTNNKNNNHHSSHSN